MCPDTFVTYVPVTPDEGMDFYPDPHPNPLSQVEEGIIRNSTMPEEKSELNLFPLEGMVEPGMKRISYHLDRSDETQEIKSIRAMESRIFGTGLMQTNRILTRLAQFALKVR